MASQAAELKAQGAIEAAQLSDHQAAADAAERAIVEQSKNAGVAAFHFDPDASPEEKRRQAQAVRDTKDPDHTIRPSLVDAPQIDVISPGHSPRAPEEIESCSDCDRR